MKRREVQKEGSVKDRGGQQGRPVGENGGVTGQRKEECSLGRVQAGLVIKSEIKEQLQGTPLLYESDPLLMPGSRIWLQQDLITASVGVPMPWNKGSSRLLGYGAILPLALGWRIPILALCFSAPAEERSCSWLNPWVFLVSVLAIKTAFVTVCLGGFQGLLISLG